MGAEEAGKDEPVLRFARGHFSREMEKLRKLVSGDKYRYIDPVNGVNLDLTYITPRIIAMVHYFFCELLQFLIVEKFRVFLDNQWMHYGGMILMK